MNVMFINISPDCTYPPGIGALSSFIRRNGHCSKSIDIVTNKPLINESQYNYIAKELNSFNPRLIGFTVFETGFHWVKQICDFIKKTNPSIITVAGGYYPTLAPEEVINYDSVDIICRGEGEYALLELISGLESNNDIKTIRNLWVKQNGEIYKNRIRPLIENLDDLPFWDREIFDYQSHLNLSRKGDRNVKMMAGRGCPYQCTYCSNLYFKELYPNKNKYFRMRTVNHVIEELIYLKNNFDFDYVGFHDDNLTLFPNWLEEFSEEYRKKVNIPFYCAARVETCSEENLDYLKMAGCFMVLIGIECGDEDYRKKAMNRKMSNKSILDACKRVKERKMLLWTFNMVGMPGETRKHLLKTVFLSWKISPDFAMTSIFYPFKGTEMGDFCYKEGLVNPKKKEMIGSYANDTILDHPNISTLEMKIAKYFTIFSAMRSHNSFFYKALLERVRKIFPINLSLFNR
jgi:radical SAM superfamily enzyme YgiQ (UPF0313 family)